MIRFAAAAASLALVTACATQPEPCTPEWVQWKSEKVLNAFASDHRGFIKELRNIEGKLENPGPLTALRIIGLADDAAVVIEDFQAEVMPQLRSAYQQCGTVEKMMPTFVKFLRQEGVSEETLKWVEGLGAMVETLQK